MYLFWEGEGPEGGTLLDYLTYSPVFDEIAEDRCSNVQAIENRISCEPKEELQLENPMLLTLKKGKKKEKHLKSGSIRFRTHQRQ